MLTISAIELGIVCRSKTLRELRIEQLESGRFVVAAVIKTEDQPRTLVTHRNHRREWASLDTLCRHIGSQYGRFIPSAKLNFHQGVSS